MEFRDQTIVITGMSSGFGLASARKFAAAGARIVGIDRNAARLEKEVASLPVPSMNHFGIVRDLQPANAAREVIEEIAERVARIDGLVNSAGVCHFTKIAEISPNEWDEVFETDARALFYLSTAVAERMKTDGKGGSIVNLGSNAGRKGRTTSAHYAAAKAAVINITESLALAYGPSQIRVNTVAPAVVLTPMWEQNFAELVKITGKTPQELETAWTNQTPLRRLGTADDVAELIVFLSGKRGAFITGQNINVCGGFMHTC